MRSTAVTCRYPPAVVLKRVPTCGAPKGPLSGMVPRVRAAAVREGSTLPASATRAQPATAAASAATMTR
ncbi:MAG TPA: hypothetical protein VMC10_23870 [Stellaceae bacterium]|nr:hypothetical protein [Stellaceae bacterium]